MREWFCVAIISSCFSMASVVFVLLAITVLLSQAVVLAQTDEIQVYDAAIAEPGVFNLTWHNNFIADGANRSCLPRWIDSG